MTYSDARAQLKGVMDRAIHDKQEVVVTRKKGESIKVSVEHANPTQAARIGPTGPSVHIWTFEGTYHEHTDC